MSTLLMTTIKDEGPFILEWVLYNRLIGFDRIVVYSNDCSDGSDTLLDVLAEEGWLTHHRSTPPPEATAQGAAAEAMFASEAYAGCTWFCWLDPDEYLNIHVGEGRVPDLIGAIGDALGMVLNWRLFGHSGVAAWADGLTIETFCRCAGRGHAENSPTKSFFRRHPLITQLYQHRPFLDPAFEGSGERFITCDGDPVPHDFLGAMRKTGNPLQTLPNRQRKFSLAQVNHYAVRSYDVFSLKRFRGQGAKPIGADEALRGRRYGEKFWVKRDRNEREDRSILRHAPALREAMAGALAKPRIRAAHYACCAAMAARLAEMAADGQPMTAAEAGLA
ncbi:MAG: glycosyltransferase family 2 protein [Pseudomonadota bacterium]